MKKTWTMTVLAGALLVGGTLAAADDTPASPSVNFTHGRKCQLDGWKSLRTAAGDSFADQGACVAYTIQGGELFRMVPIAAPEVAGDAAHVSMRRQARAFSTSAAIRTNSTVGRTP